MSSKPRLAVLDLCSGTGSVASALREMFGDTHDILYVSVDNERKFEPTYCVDVREWDGAAALAADYPDVQRWDIVWASPPCTEYSLAKSRGQRNFLLADSIVWACVELIRELRPRYWYMENPATGHLHRRAFMADLVPYRHTVHYCRYGAPYKKPTHIWTNADFSPLLCSSGTPCEAIEGGRHPATSQRGTHKAPRSDGSRARPSKRDEAYVVPTPLLRDLFAGVSLPLSAASAE